MGLRSFFQRHQRQSKAAPSARSGDVASAVESARTSARRRLIGAVILLGIGVIALPLLFETQPRPIPVDIAIEIPRPEGAAPLVVPAPRAPVVEPAAAPAVPAASPATPAEPVKLEAAPPAAASRPTIKIVSPAASSARALAAAPAPSVAAPAQPGPVASGRFVVQVGAFADAQGVREVRGKVEKLGLRTYTQAVATGAGKRIRVRLGPFASRDEAEKAAAKLKAAGLPAAILTL